MSALLLGVLYSSRAVGMAQPLQPSSQAHATPLVTRLISNATITCIFNGVEYFMSSPSPNTITCESMLRDATMSVANSANDRSVTGILWSCLATVFACTWVSVHPNIPHPDASEWQIRRHRFLMMLCGLVAPELIVLWALRQWIGAHRLVKIMQEKDIQGFTVVHGHFMQMGGFMLYSEGARVSVIEDYNLFVSSVTEWKFILPTVEEIRDRSKGDGLSKALVVGQTGWFVVQCISRWVAGLAITEMELVTLAFAALNGIIYFLWWNKPLDVRYAVQVVRQGVENDDNVPEMVLVPPVTTYIDHRMPTDDMQFIRKLVADSPVGRLISAMRSHFSRGDEARVDRCLKVSVLHSNCDSEDTFAATAVASAIGILFGVVHCIAWKFHFLSHQERTLWRVWSTVITTSPIVLFTKSALSYIFTKRYLQDRDDLYIQNDRFEGTALFWVLEKIIRPSIWATILLVPIYGAARVGLLVQALVALRDLQPAERAQVQWVQVLPHL